MKVPSRNMNSRILSLPNTELKMFVEQYFYFTSEITAVGKYLKHYLPALPSRKTAFHPYSFVKYSHHLLDKGKEPGLQSWHSLKA